VYLAGHLAVRPKLSGCDIYDSALRYNEDVIVSVMKVGVDTRFGKLVVQFA
jgi:hypothetical protein